MHPPNPSRAIAWCFIVFWSGLLLSGIGFKASARFLGWPRWSEHKIEENRSKNPRPSFRETPVREWGGAIDRWYNDNFAWRSRVIQFYRYVCFDILRTAVAGELVPGRDGWLFRKGGTWAELEDYLGAFELTSDEIARWVELFEGRKQWADAHGVLYLQFISPVKAQIHPEKLYPMIARHRGRNVRVQVQSALADSPARDNVVFLTDLVAGLTRTQTVFYASDHHVNAFGTYMIFQKIKDQLADRLGPMSIPPFYGKQPPPAVLEGREAGCYEKGRPGYERLAVVVPDMRNDGTSPPLRRGGPYPAVSVVLTQPGARRTLVLAHDSFLRYPLSSWRFKEDPIRLPIPDGFDRALSLLFIRLDTHRLNTLVSVERPAAIIEQFPEIKLTQEVYGHDETMRRAAAFGRAAPWTDPAPPPAGTPLRTMAVLEQVLDPSGTWVDMRNGRGVPEITVELTDGEQVLASATTYPGHRRALFFPEISAPGRPLSLRLIGGSGRVVSLELRVPAAPAFQAGRASGSPHRGG